MQMTTLEDDLRAQRRKIRALSLDNENKDRKIQEMELRRVSLE